MNRRHFLQLAMTHGAIAALPRWAIAGAEAPLETHLGRSWRLQRNTALEIWPARYGLNLTDALTAVLDWEIPASSRLILRLDNGLHELLKSLQVRHPDGQRLAIIGNPGRPDLCRILWSKSEDAFYVPAGCHLGEVNGITMVHDNPQRRGHGSAFLADSDGTIQCGRSLVIRGFYYGFQARYGGVIRCRGAQCHDAGDAAYFAFNGGHIDAADSIAINARDDKLRLGSGYVAEYGGTINAEGAAAINNALAGFNALSNGTIRAYHSKAEHNGVAGYLTSTGGTIVAHDGVAVRNCGPGVKVNHPSAAFEANHFTNEHNNAAAQTCLLAPQ